VPFVVEIRNGWKLYIVAGGVMVRTITPPATIYNFHPFPISTIYDTYLSRIMIDSLMVAFYM
jgi:hypothetical protein